MDTFIRLIEAEVYNALQHARIIGMVHVERDVKNHGYAEDGYIIAWQREGDRPNIGTHRAQVNNQGEVMLVHGHYDIPNTKDALLDMLDRAGAGPQSEIKRLQEESDRLHKALELSVCYSPQAIRDSFDGAEKDHPDAKWVRTATEEELLEVAHAIVGSDPTWKDFHANIEMAIEAMRQEDKAKQDA